MAASGTSGTPGNVAFCEPFVSANLQKFCADNSVKLRGGNDAQVGDIIICSDKGQDFGSPCDMGRVLRVAKDGQRLVGKDGKSHPDGPVGHVYVLSYKRQKKSRKKLECRCSSSSRLLIRYIIVGLVFSIHNRYTRLMIT